MRPYAASQGDLWLHRAPARTIQSALVMFGVSVHTSVSPQDMDLPGAEREDSGKAIGPPALSQHLCWYRPHWWHLKCGLLRSFCRKRRPRLSSTNSTWFPPSPLASKPAVSVSISNLYPGCEHVSVRSRSMMFEPGLTRGTLEVLVAPPQHLHCEAEDQSIKAIDIQNAYLNGTVARALHGSIS
ncbi:death-associated protein kinase 1-like [Ailuropoda melanoleuca]|uniref:death-associated protein kinase 1-like n=1 Tax=Ailuropoda melanoleuca TaxID=9646 RepID=UPI001494A2ED|nr:death-associated protein kinase 1-like [Ailuropoda melanoleuca]